MNVQFLTANNLVYKYLCFLSFNFSASIDGFYIKVHFPTMQAVENCIHILSDNVVPVVFANLWNRRFNDWRVYKFKNLSLGLGCYMNVQFSPTYDIQQCTFLIVPICAFTNTRFCENVFYWMCKFWRKSAQQQTQSLLSNQMSFLLNA